MSGLARFKLETSSSGQKRSGDGTPAKKKHLKEIVDFKSVGIFFVIAKIVNLQYRIYNACPLKSRGMFCRRKLDDNRHCAACGHTAKIPLKNLFLRIELADCLDPECTQYATVFSTAAEKFLQLKAVAIDEMGDNEPDTLAKILEKKLDQQVVVKLNIKEAKGEFEGQDFDWIILTIAANDDMEEDEDGGDKKKMKTLESEGAAKKVSDAYDEEIQFMGHSTSSKQGASIEKND